MRSSPCSVAVSCRAPARRCGGSARAAALPHGEVFEYCMSDSPLRHELTRERFAVEDGFVKVSDAPGLGVTINEETVQQYLVP